jgi:hypothetical protein
VGDSRAKANNKRRLKIIDPIPRSKSHNTASQPRTISKSSKKAVWTREGGGGDCIEEQEDTGFRESEKETRVREAREYIEEEEGKGFLERGRLVEDAGHCVSAFLLCVCALCV